ncbi:MAG: alanine dehydrogenase [Methanofollis sp.]|nr:alanine dehydrogenase [Methanofollis sp.]
MYYYPGQTDLPSPHEVNRAVEEAFREYGEGLVQMPPKVYVIFPKGDFRTMPAYLPSTGIAGVKIVNVHPENPKSGLPTVMALTIILDVDTGMPQAVLNATALTNLRTGAAGAIAAKYLSRKKRITLGVVGSGRQAAAQVNAIADVLEIEEILVWSRTAEKTVDFCRQFEEIGCVPGSVEDACNADVIVTTTPSRTPLMVPMPREKRNLTPHSCCGAVFLLTIRGRRSTRARSTCRSRRGFSGRTRSQAPWEIWSAEGRKGREITRLRSSTLRALRSRISRSRPLSWDGESA